MSEKISTEEIIDDAYDSATNSLKVTVVGGSVALASVLGALDDAAATGAVTETDTGMSYIKQIVTSEIALTTAVGNNLVVTGTFTTSSATVPADTGRGESTNFYNGSMIVPLTGAVAFQGRIIDTFTATTGVFTLRQPFTAAPGTVAYAILPRQSFQIGQRDIWCADSAVLNVTVPATGADLDFPSVVVGAAGTATGIPLNATILSVNMMLIANTLDSSAAANYLKTAADQINVKLSSASWGTGDIEAWRTIAGAWYTPASGMSGVAFISATDIASVVTGAGTYNFRSEETNRTKGIEAQGASLVLKDCKVGLRIHYKI